MTLLERVVLGLRQNRVSPHKVALAGWVQPVFDGLKLTTSELILFNKREGFNTKMLSLFILSLMCLNYLNLPSVLVRWFMTSLLFLLMLRLAVLSLLLLALKRQNKYARLGGFRAASNRLAFDFTILFLLLILIQNSKRLNLEGITALLGNLLWGLIILLLCLQELGRTPFDLPEAERELISGFNIELSAIYFVLVFLTEYGNMIFLSYFRALVICQGSFFIIFTTLMLLLYSRRVLPRIRVEKRIALSFFTLALVTLSCLFFV